MRLIFRKYAWSRLSGSSIRAFGKSNSTIAEPWLLPRPASSLPLSSHTWPYYSSRYGKGRIGGRSWGSWFLLALTSPFSRSAKIVRDRGSCPSPVSPFCSSWSLVRPCLRCRAWAFNDKNFGFRLAHIWKGYDLAQQKLLMASLTASIDSNSTCHN